MTDSINPGAPTAPQMFRMLGIASSGLQAHRVRMDTVAMNIANAETTRSADGGPYRRRVVELEPTQQSPFVDAIALAQGNTYPESEADAATGVRVRGITEDTTSGPRVYEPGHPDADADGYVTYPNVSITDEMVELMDARRMFEANATVFQVAKAMLRRSLDI
jgi:flagellar basal-body rod protein FlgC